jgi:hypothetical protein
MRGTQRCKIGYGKSDLVVVRGEALRSGFQLHRVRISIRFPHVFNTCVAL